MLVCQPAACGNQAALLEIRLDLLLLLFFFFWREGERSRQRSEQALNIQYIRQYIMNLHYVTIRTVAHEYHPGQNNCSY